MDPARKRTIRLVVALSAAVVLATALIYTSFNASTEAKTPSELLAVGATAKSYELTGKVAEGTLGAPTAPSTASGCATARAPLRSRSATPARCRTRSARVARS